MTPPTYLPEILDPDYDDGTMPENVDALQTTVVGHRIVKAEKREVDYHPYDGDYSYRKTVFVITLDDGREVQLADTSDCCAYTELEEFWLHPEAVDHVILGVGTTDQYATWHIYADFGDVMKLTVGWSPGNPFYYGYGFSIRVRDVEH